jgi:hypothetical protein
MGHALVEYGQGHFRANTYTLEAAVAAMSAAATEKQLQLGPVLANWLSYWCREVHLYGVAHFHLDLDRLLADAGVRQEFLRLLEEAQEWVRAQGGRISGALIFDAVGGKHWSSPDSEGWATDLVDKLLVDLRRLVASEA